MSDPKSWQTAAVVCNTIAFLYCVGLLGVSFVRVGGLPVPWFRAACVVACVLLSVAVVIVVGAGWAAWQASTTP